MVGGKSDNPRKQSYVIFFFGYILGLTLGLLGIFNYFEFQF